MFFPDYFVGRSKISSFLNFIIYLETKLLRYKPIYCGSTVAYVNW